MKESNPRNNPIRTRKRDITETNKEKIERTKACEKKIEFGGAMTHNTKSGVAHFVAASDEDCIDPIKKLLGYLPLNNREKAPVAACINPVNRIEEKLNTLVPEQSNRPYDIKKVIKLVVDNGEIYESQALKMLENKKEYRPWKKNGNISL